MVLGSKAPFFLQNSMHSSVGVTGGRLKRRQSLEGIRSWQKNSAYVHVLWDDSLHDLATQAIINYKSTAKAAEGTAKVAEAGLVKQPLGFVAV